MVYPSRDKRGEGEKYFEREKKRLRCIWGGPAKGRGKEQSNNLCFQTSRSKDNGSGKKEAKKENPESADRRS